MKLGVIIAILIVVYQVVTLIVKAAGKQAEAERTRTGRAAQGGTTPRGAVRRPGTPTRREDLEARRQAQLQQLRMRRQARASGEPTGRPPAQARVGPAPVQPQPRPGRPAAAPPPARSVAPRQPAPINPTSPIARIGGPALFERRRKRMEALREQQAAQEAAEARARREAVERARREAVERQRREAETKARRAAERAAEEELARARDVGGLDLRSLYRRLRNPGALREAIVLKEILEPPIALRERRGLD